MSKIAESIYYNMCRHEKLLKIERRIAFIAAIPYGVLVFYLVFKPIDAEMIRLTSIAIVSFIPLLTLLIVLQHIGERRAMKKFAKTHPSLAAKMKKGHR